MKISRVRFSGTVVGFDDNQCPVIHRFQNAEQGLTIEVRQNDRHIYVSATLEQDGVTRHAGNCNGHWAHSDYELTTTISTEMFKMADELGVAAHHIWPFVEQLPLYTECGVSVTEAQELAEPIKDLLARGATPTEVMNTLNVGKDTIEFVIGTKIPGRRSLRDYSDLGLDTTEY